MRTRSTLRRIHIWLGWLVGLPLLFWVVSGLIMVSRPIEEVRGEGLIRDPAAISAAAPLVPPRMGPRPVRSVTLEQRAGGPVWLIRYLDGGAGRADATTGRPLAPLTAAEAAELVRSRYAGAASLGAVTRVSADAPPLEFRRNIAAWQVAMSDGTRLYVDAATGEIAARRTPFWRIYDFMWGLHIMDLTTREDTSNPLVIGLAIVSLVTVVLALVLLPMTLRKRRTRSAAEAAVR